VAVLAQGFAPDVPEFPDRDETGELTEQPVK
jgi:hypothetical protein